VEAVFILLILAGRAFGARFGLLLGAATDGANIGADVATLSAGIVGVVEGTPGQALPAAPTRIRMLR
jgi:hypothetical protein